MSKIDFLKEQIIEARTFEGNHLKNHSFLCMVPLQNDAILLFAFI